VTTGRRRRPKRKSLARRRIAWGLAAVLVFAIGVALGEALNDNPGPGHTRTLERTFTLAPESATVTVTSP
jgi:tetrahydromethanopterin S-methyltransferase subunit C